jgi:amino acid permease
MKMTKPTTSTRHIIFNPNWILCVLILFFPLMAIIFGKGKFHTIGVVTAIIMYGCIPVALIIFFLFKFWIGEKNIAKLATLKVGDSEEKILAVLGASKPFEEDKYPGGIIR